MKVNKWTMALAAGGVVSLGSIVQAEEAQHQVLTALSQTTLSGYVDTSAIWKLGTGNTLPGRAYDGAGKLDGFNLNVVKLSLEKALDEAQWAAGYKVDLLFGPDAVTYQAPAIFNSGSSFGSGGDDFAIQNAFVELRAPIGNGIDLKVGAFESPLGYEAFDSGKNPNYSRSFGYILGPKQHTGVLASYQLADSLSIYGGVANTHTGAINSRPRGAESEKTYLGGITLSAPESLGFLSGSTLYAGIVDGLANVQNDTTSVYVGATIPTPMEGLSIGAAWDYRFDGFNLVTPATGNKSNWASAIAGYVSYQATEKLKLNDRFDYVTGSDGTLGLDLGRVNSSDKQPEIMSNTVTVDYSLWDNVISRAEFRWDHSLTGDKLYGRGAGDQKNAFTLAANIIYKF
jgi:hypothetical protein